ncbi:MAG: hypothetical protein GY862_18460, partial [Gammaproteobacteria bacterium]|nr:hypothetical protein [Gammaproteobacteria bacterium]
IIKQGERLDDLAKQLFTLELAIPGLYVTVLKLTAEHKLANTPLLWVTFIVWAAAWAITLIGMFPRSYKVSRNVIRREQADGDSDGISIEEFYQRSARHKYRTLAWAGGLFFFGIFCAMFTIFA